MRERPTSLSVIGAIFLIFGLWALFGMAISHDTAAFEEAAAPSSLGREGVLIINVLGGLITAASGFGVLKGMNWSRYLWTGWSVAALALGLLTAPPSWLALGTAAVIAVAVYYLFRPQANQWFDRSHRA